MTRGRPAKPSKINQKVSVAVVAGVTGLGTMLCMMPASFAGTLQTNNESQNTSSKAISAALKASKLNQTQSSLDSIKLVSDSMGSLSLDTTGYQTQAKQQAVAENLSTLTQNLEGILHDTPYMSKLTAVQSALESVENTLKTPNLPTFDLKGPEKTQGKLQNLVKELQTIINDASTQYDTELKNAAIDYNNNLYAATSGLYYDALAEPDGGTNFTEYLYEVANAYNNDPNLASASNTFSTNAGAAANWVGSTSFLGKAEALQQNAENQLNNINTELKSYYNATASSATDTLVTDAKNFDTRMQNWWKDRTANNNKSGSQYGYTQTFLPLIKELITEVSSAISSGSTSNSADAKTVLKNLKALQASVEYLQSITENFDPDLASLPPDEAFSKASQQLNNMDDLQTFLMRPVAYGDLPNWVPSCVPGYGGQIVVMPSPLANPFTGTEGAKIWNTISDTLAGYDGNMPQMGTLNNIEWKWEQDYANYKYLQVMQGYAQGIASEAQTALNKAQDAANKIAAAKQLADQNTGGSASDASAAAQAKADIQSALQDVAAANSAGGEIYDAMCYADDQYANATNSNLISPSITTISGSTVSLPTTISGGHQLYSWSYVDTINSDFSQYVGQANNLLSGSDSGTGTGGLLGDAAVWQEAVVTHSVFNNAQKAYNAMKGVQQDWKNVMKSDPNLFALEPMEPINPGAGINSLHKLQSDFTTLFNDLQSVVTSMQNGNQTIQGLGLRAPYTQLATPLSVMQAELSAADGYFMPLASASDASNPIQKAIVNGNEYNFAHSIVVGLQPHVQVSNTDTSGPVVVGLNFQPDIRSLIGQGSEPGDAQKILALPFQTMPAASVPSGTANSGQSSHMTHMPSQVQVQQAKPSGSHLASTGSSTASMPSGTANSGKPSQMPQMPSGTAASSMSQMPSQGQVQVQQAKPSGSHLASTGASIEAASISAGVLLAAGIAAELLKKKRTERNK